MTSLIRIVINTCDPWQSPAKSGSGSGVRRYTRKWYPLFPVPHIHLIWVCCFSNNMQILLILWGRVSCLSRAASLELLDGGFLPGSILKPVPYFLYFESHIVWVPFCGFIVTYKSGYQDWMWVYLHPGQEMDIILRCNIAKHLCVTWQNGAQCHLSQSGCFQPFCPKRSYIWSVTSQ